MSDEAPKDKKHDDVLEAITEIGPLRMRSTAEIVEQDDGSVSFEISGPFLSFLEADDDSQQDDEE